MSASEQRILLIDGHAMAFRAFFALPADSFTDGRGQSTNAVYGFTRMIINVVASEQPTHVAVAFDLPGGTFRDRIYDQYKAGREVTPPEFEGQIGLIQQVLDASAQVEDLAKDMKDATSVLFLGRHVGYPTAMEGALKLKEIAYIHAEGFAAGELKHGPIALIEEGQPVFVIVPSPRGRDVLHSKVISNIQEVRARGARTLVIAEEGDDEVLPYADVVIRIPQTRTLFAALLTVIPLQILSLIHI